MITFASLLLLTSLAAAPDTVGVAVSGGAFRVGDLMVQGTGSIPPGGVVETVEEPSRLILRSGAKVEMDVHSRTRIFGDRIVVESGRSRISGPAQVVNPQGVLLARIQPGRMLDFAPSAASTAAVQVSGVLETQDSSYWVTDQLTQVRFQLKVNDVESAKSLKPAVGTKVEVAGVFANNMIETTTVHPAKGLSAVETIAAAGTTVSKAVIAGVAIAGAGAAAGVGFAVSQSSKSTSTVSQ